MTDHHKAQSVKQTNETARQRRGVEPVDQEWTRWEQADQATLQRAVANPGLARPADILNLQRAYGNRAVSRLIQAKLMVGPVGDKYEREADQVAEQVMSMPMAASITPLVQRQAEEEEEVQAKPLTQRQDIPEEEELQTKPLVQRRADGGFEGHPDLERRLAAHKRGGGPLPVEVRAFMEPRLGADFSAVQVHTDSEAAQMSRELKAQSFTHGQDIYFGAGKYAPGSSAGKRLLAHELTHVVQQTGKQVQRDSGQRAQPVVQRVYQPRQVGTSVNWASANPQTDVTASEAGALGGVFFIRVGGTTHVLKAAGDSMAAMLFAEWMLERVSGGQPARSTPIKVDSPEGRAILALIDAKCQRAKEARDSAQQNFERAKGTEGEHQALEALRAADFQFSSLEKKKGNFSGSQYIAAQTMMGGIPLGRLMGEKSSKEDPTGARFLVVMRNIPFWENAGHVLAADTFIGNADRFEQLNVGNAFGLAHKMIGLIDNEAIFQQFGADAPNATRDAKEWTQSVIGLASKMERPVALSPTGMGAPVAAVVELMTDFGKVFDKYFKARAYDEYVGSRFASDPGKANRDAIFNQADWDAVKKAMGRGFDTGLTALFSFLQADTMAMREEFKGLSAQFAGDLNMDIHALKARTRYMRDVRGGATSEQAQQQTVAYAKYVKEWKPQYRRRMDAITTIDPASLVVPEGGRPRKLTKTEKTKRFFTVAWFSKAQQQAKQLKQQARTGQVSPALEANVQQLATQQDPGTSRRAIKALYLAKLRKFINDLSTRAELVGQLHVEVRNLRAQQAGGQGITAELAQKKLAHMRKQLVPRDAGTLRIVYNGIKNAKTRWEQGLAGSEERMLQELRNRYDAFYNALNQFIRKLTQ